MLSVILIMLLVIPLHTLGKPSRKIKAIDFVNHVNNLKDSTWKADTYGFSEIAMEDFVNRFGLKFKKKKPKKSEVAKKPDPPANSEPENVPQNFTWVPSNINDKNMKSSDTYDCPIENIYDQSNCGSCWAVSTAAVFGDRLCLASNGTFKLPISANQIIACDQQNAGCLGGYLDDVLNYLQYNGTVTGGSYESDEGCQTYTIPTCGNGNPSKMPCASFTHLQPKCKILKCNNKYYEHKEEKQFFKIKDWKHFARDPYLKFTANKQDIFSFGPIIAGFYVYEDFFFYKSGIYEHTIGALMDIHAVRVVGWGTSNGTEYWHVANSWGKDWGENGFFRIKRGVFSNGYFEREMYTLYVNGTIS